MWLEHLPMGTKPNRFVFVVAVLFLLLRVMVILRYTSCANLCHPLEGLQVGIGREFEVFPEVSTCWKGLPLGWVTTLRIFHFVLMSFCVILVIH